MYRTMDSTLNIEIKEILFKCEIMSPNTVPLEF